MVVLGVLAGLTAGLAVAAFDGAQRTATALHRLEARNNASDAVVFASQTSSDKPYWTTLASRPEVASIARWRLLFGLVGDEYTVMFGPSDDVWLQQIDRPIVVAGRMFDPSKPNEVVVDDQAGADAPPLGSTVQFDAFGRYDPAVGDVPGSGPSVQLTVVGVIHTSLSWEFTSGGFVSPAFFAKYGDQVEFAENAFVQLRHGGGDMTALRRDASRDLFAGVPVLDLRTTARRVTATTDVEKAMLMLLAGIVAVAGLVFVGQAIARSAATIGSDVPTLRALGMTRREMLAAALRPHTLTAITAALTLALTTTIASRWFPVGLAAQVDPARGIRVDVALVLGAIVALVVLITAQVALSSWLAAAPTDGRRRVRASLLTRVGLMRPLAVGVGVRMALEGNRSTGRGGSRSALVGAVAAVAGIVAIVTLNHGLDDSLSHPQVAGVAWDVTVTPNAEDTSLEGVNPTVVDAVIDQPGLAATGTIGRVTVQIGEVGVPTFTVIPRGTGSQIQLVTLQGRPPDADDEIELGPSTARDLGVDIGDTIQLEDGRAARVVGLGLFPSDVHAQFDEGAWVSNSRWFDLLGRQDTQEGAEFAIAVRFADRDHIADQTQTLATALAPVASDVAPAEVPYELSNLHNVRRLPTLLAIFLTVLGIVAVGHALFTTVRRRGKDFAVMSALGVTRTGSRIVLAVQGSTVAVVGLLFGLPLGLLAGRAGWQAITDRVPLTFRSPIAFVGILLIAPIAIVVANALAVLPGHRAAKLEPALILRSE
ncbi:MAG: hypothetical protein JWN39_3965 [Ilumatobacteraceae bacterium]|nr:hypothetical protein [Ilumatobacteraceae bacterium]